MPSSSSLSTSFDYLLIYLYILLRFSHSDMHDHASFCRLSAIDGYCFFLLKRHTHLTNTIYKNIKRTRTEQKIYLRKFLVVVFLFSSFSFFYSSCYYHHVALYAHCMQVYALEMCNVSKLDWCCCRCSSFSLVSISFCKMQCKQYFKVLFDAIEFSSENNWLDIFF